MATAAQRQTPTWRARSFLPHGAKSQRALLLWAALGPLGEQSPSPPLGLQQYVPSCSLLAHGHSLIFPSPSRGLGTFGSRLLRCAHRHLSCLELASKLQPARAACRCSSSSLVKPLKETLVQRRGLAQTELTGRLLVLALDSKKLHPSCSLGHREALVCH